jgi:hypothetical protein
MVKLPEILRKAVTARLWIRAIVFLAFLVAMALWRTPNLIRNLSLDVILDLASVVLPTLLSVVGVLVSIKAPHSKHHTWLRISLIALGIFVSLIILWQQARSRNGHAAEITQLNTELKRIENNTHQPPKIQVNVPAPQVIIPPSKPPEPADLRAEFVAPEDIELIVFNQSSATAYQPTFQTILVDLERSSLDILPIGRQTGDFLRPHSRLLRIPLLHYGNTAAADLVKPNIWMDCTVVLRLLAYTVLLALLRVRI